MFGRYKHHIFIIIIGRCAVECKIFDFKEIKKEVTSLSTVYSKKYLQYINIVNQKKKKEVDCIQKEFLNKNLD